MPSLKSKILLLALCLSINPLLFAQSKTNPVDKFRQLEELLPTPNEQRSASGAPGPKYWQQRADYKIEVELDDAKQRIIGSETITYFNYSPDPLSYLWLQLDQNVFAAASEANSTATAPEFKREPPPVNFDPRNPPTPGQPQLPYTTLDQLLAREAFDGAVRITAVRDGRGGPLRHTIVRTMMRIDLPQPLAPGQSTVFSVDWNYNINDQRKLGGRTGYEFFAKTATTFTRLPTGFRGWRLTTTFRVGNINSFWARASSPLNSAITMLQSPRPPTT